jgi:hypothetical protein
VYPEEVYPEGRVYPEEVYPEGRVYPEDIVYPEAECILRT